MSEKEKLVEEIAEKIIGYYDGCPVVAEEDREISRAIITLILSAVRDGRLELPGEVGRVRCEIPILGSLDELGFKYGDILIALRPLSGTGKEEER